MRYHLLPVVLFLAAPARAQVPEPYAQAVQALSALAEREVKDKNLPALSVALVDDQRVVWAKGFGHRDSAKQVPADADTVYRVGSVSKLFTDIAVMQLVEEGKLDLDKPVTEYLPDFKPVTPEKAKSITLRMLMSHRSGLIREPPVGNYFDPTEPTLAKTAASLNGIPLIYPPGEKAKYSNAAIGMVGYVLEKTRNEKFEKYVQRRVLDPLGMKASSFLPTDAVKKNLAEAVMWTYHGREFPAPTFELGMAPAGCMYSTVTDLAKFQSALFAGTAVLKPETFETMFTPQFAAKDAKTGFGLGFFVSEFEGRRKIGHGGAIYGFATSWAALPKDKLGVVVVCSRDVANAVMDRLGDHALRLMLAAKDGKPLPNIDLPEPLSADEAVKLAGRYSAKDRWFDLEASAGRLYFTSDRGGYRLHLRKLGNALVSDDTQNVSGLRFARDGDTLSLPNGTKYAKDAPAAEPPPEPPAKWKGLIGEYGWDHNTLFIYERDGKLHALVEWTEIAPLKVESDDVFAFPTDRGMYHGEKIVFTRDKTGRATTAVMASVPMVRRKLDGENGETFRVKPTTPIAELRKAALAAVPPKEAGEFLKPDLVDLATVDGVKFDIRYAGDNNFMGVPFYSSAKAFLQKPAAAALGKVNAKLKERGIGLLVFDAYRPWHVTKMFWDGTEEKFHTFVADPSKGSRHNRGCAVDLGLYDLKTGKPIEVVSGFDEFSDRAFPDYPGGTSRQRWYRDLLRRTMEAEGFAVYSDEWWHFDYQDWKRYPILNKTFEELAGEK